MVMVTTTAPLLAVAGGFCKTSEIDACMQHRCDARAKLRTADSSFASLAEIGAVRLQLGQIGRAVRLVVGLDVVPEATWKALVPTFLTALFELRERVRRAPRVAARGGGTGTNRNFSCQGNRLARPNAQRRLRTEGRARGQSACPTTKTKRDKCTGACVVRVTVTRVEEMRRSCVPKPRAGADYAESGFALHSESAMQRL